MDDYITATDLALLTGKSVQWVCKLCTDGRIAGARKEGNKWMLDPMTRLPEDSRVTKRQAKERHIAELKALRDQFKDSPQLPVAKFTYGEEKALEAIKNGFLIDRNGTIWKRVADGTVGATDVRGVYLKRVGAMLEWQRADEIFYANNGGETDPAKLAIQAA